MTRSLFAVVPALAAAVACGAAPEAPSTCDPDPCACEPTAAECLALPGETAPDNPFAPDCGPFGLTTSSGCRCAPGYTQTGLGAERTCEPLPRCRGGDDDLEPNDVPSLGTFVADARQALYACPGNPDWYLYQVETGDRVEVVLEFDGDQVDLDLFLFAPGIEDPVARSLGTGSREVARFVADREGTAGVLIEPYGLGEGDYRFTVEVRGE